MLYILAKPLYCILSTKVFAFRQAGGYKTLAPSTHKTFCVYAKLTLT
jgi:hypothetical protein